MAASDRSVPELQEERPDLYLEVFNELQPKEAKKEELFSLAELYQKSQATKTDSEAGQAKTLLQFIQSREGLRLTYLLELRIKRLRKAALLASGNIAETWGAFENEIKTVITNWLRTAMHRDFLKEDFSRAIKDLHAARNFYLEALENQLNEWEKNEQLQPFLRRVLEKESVDKLALRAETHKQARGWKAKINNYEVEDEAGECDLLAMVTLPKKQALFNQMGVEKAYIRLQNPNRLYYANKVAGLVEEVKLEPDKLAEFDREMPLTPPPCGRALGKNHLEKITRITGHTRLETPAMSQKRAEKLLKTEGFKELRKGARSDAPTKAREAFILKLEEILADPAKEFKVSGFDPLRSFAPDQCATTMEAFLGKEGLELYQAAVQEEAKSGAFRDAFFLKSITHYPGNKWRESLVLWVGGPASSGKSFVADEATRTVDPLMDKIPGNQEGNNVVAIDGGIERAVSQMRQLVLQAALKKGYPGIRDLQKKTPLGLKKHVQAAALKADLSIVIPKTFSDYIKNYIPLPISLPNSTTKVGKYSEPGRRKEIFAEVLAPPGKEKIFKSTVGRLGILRAYSQRFDVQHTTKRTITMNNRAIGIESKRYQRKGFEFGVNGSAFARRKYQESKTADKIYIPIINDLIFVRRDATDPHGRTWLPCEDDYQGEALKISDRYFEKWKIYLSGGTEPKMPVIAAGLDLPAWLKEYEKRMGSPPALKKIYRNGDEMETRAAASIPRLEEDKTSSELKSDSLEAKAALTRCAGIAALSPQGLVQLEAAKKGQISALSRAFNSAIIGDKLSAWGEDLFKKHKARGLGDALSNLNMDEIAMGMEQHGNAIFDKDGDLVEWLKDELLKQQLPAEAIEEIALFLKDYYTQLRLLSFTPEGKVQPWFIEAINAGDKNNYSTLVKNTAGGKIEIASKTLAAIALLLNEALMELSERYPRSKSFVNFATFLTNAQIHFNRTFIEAISDLEQLAKQRQPDEASGHLIAATLAKYKPLVAQAIANPLTYIAEARTELLQVLEEIKEKNLSKKAEHSLMLKEEKIESKPTPPLSSTARALGSSSTFATEPAAGLKTSTPLADTHKTLHTHDLTIIPTKGTSIKATIVERCSENGAAPISDLTQIDKERLDTSKILAQAAYNFVDPRNGERLAWFDSEEKARGFFAKAFKEFRRKDGGVFKDNLYGALKEIFGDRPGVKEDQLAMLATSLFKLYKNTSEQLEPINSNPQIRDPYDERLEYFPSDAFIRLAKLHVESHLALCEEEKPSLVLNTNCWDPHYVEAVMLYCHMKGLLVEYNQNEGWEAEPSSQKKEAFKDFYKNKFGTFDEQHPLVYSKPRVEAERASEAITPPAPHRW